MTEAGADYKTRVPGAFPYSSEAINITRDISEMSDAALDIQNNGAETRYPSHALPDSNVFQYLAPLTDAPRIGANMFRYNTMQKIQLTNHGNFVVDIPVPLKVSAFAPNLDPEFTHLTYTAVVGDPNEYEARGYSLRQVQMERRTEIFIVVTMYNENEILFLRTWRALCKNIEYICKKKNSKIWDENGWRSIVVCIVADGRSKIQEKTLAALGLLGVYQEGVMRTSIRNCKVSAHLFEYTVSIALTDDFKLRSLTSNSDEPLATPVQLLFCLKEKNAKKINSHRWFFNAFGRVLNPEICVLVDVGTKPSSKSVYYLWKEFHFFPEVAGACGEIYVDKGNLSSKLLNPLVASQNFEYKISNILDKPFESIFGLISVLPGAFSAYRYRALQNRGDGVGPLERYFVGENMSVQANLQAANMYLAEDRILCFELVTKREEAWTLRYVKKAKAETDVPDSVPEFISQRRRWLNGSFFAALHSILHFWQIFRSGHTWRRKAALIILLLYHMVNLLFNWFAISSFYLTFLFLSLGIVNNKSTDPFYGHGVAVYITLRQMYQFSIVMMFIAALGNRPQGSRLLYTMSFLLFAIIMGVMLYMAGFTIHLAMKNVITISTVTDINGNSNTDIKVLTELMLKPAFRDLVLSIVSTYGVYLFTSVIHVDVAHMFTSFLQYLLLLPSYVNILMIYAFCNLHDVSWGTKGDNKIAEPVNPVFVKKENGVETATVDFPVNQSDIDQNYDIFSTTMKPKDIHEPPTERVKMPHTNQEDYFKTFRTQVLLLWIISNSSLVAILTTPELASKIGIDLGNYRSFNPYLTLILWTTALLAYFRFFGSLLYIITQRNRLIEPDRATV